MREYPATVAVTAEADAAVVEVSDDDLAALNAFCAARGVYLSCLTPRSASLEDVFMDLTSDANGGAAA